MNRNQYMVAILAFFALACDGEEGKRTEYLEYSLEKVDSIRVNRSTQFRMLDFNEGNNEFLAFDPVTSEFLRIDAQGNVLEAVKRYGEGPHEYSTSLIAASFNHEGEGYFVQSSNEFIRYNSDWTVEKRLRISPYHTITLYSGPKLKVPYYRIQGNSEPYFFANFFSGISVHSFDTKEDLFSKKLIELYNPVKGSLESVLPLDQELLPSSELKEKELKLWQIYAMDKEAKLLYLTFQFGNVIGVYDFDKDFELIEKITFDHQEFTQTNKSKNVALLNFEEAGLGLLYFTGISEGAAQIKKEQNSGYLPFQDPELYRFVMLKDGTPLKKEIQFPIESEPHSEIVQLANNRILLRDRDSGDVEPEFSSYSIYELLRFPH